MRKVWLTLLGIVIGITVVSLFGPLTGLLISAAVLYAGIHFYLKARSTFAKVVWVIVGIIGLTSGISNIPGLVALVAVAGGYFIYKKWNQKETQPVFTQKSDDPFTNFEKQWNELQK